VTAVPVPVLVPVGRIAWRNVRKNWRHSLGSLLSIVVGFIAIVIFDGYLADLEDLQGRWYEQRSMFGTLLVEQAGASESVGRENPAAFLLGAEEQAFLDGFLRAEGPAVDNRVRVLFVSGLASTGRTGVVFFAWAYDVPEGARMRGPWAWNAVAGVPLQLAAPESVLVGGGLAALLDCVGPPVEQAVRFDGTLSPEARPFTCRQPRVQLTTTTVHGQLNAVDPQVAGIFDGGLKELDARFVLMPMALAQRLLDTDGVTFYAVDLADKRQGRAFARRLTAAARARGLDLVATPWREHAHGELYRRTMTLLRLYRLLVVFVVVTIAGMSVFTTILKSVTERVREIGTLRSLGYRRPQVTGLFTLEGGLLAVVAAAVGLAVSAILTTAINAGRFSYSGGIASQPIPLTVSLQPASIAFAVLFLGGVAVLASFLAARRAARLAIPDALGHAG
jgi:putative ABC transport system permease protein